VKLAMIQMRVEPGAKGVNLRHASILIAEAAQNGAQVAVLPEAITPGWTDSSTAVLADEVPGGETCELLRSLAARHKIHLCAGLVEPAGARIFNSALLVDGNSGICLHHRKIYELEIAHDCYALGDRLQVADTALGRMGVMICADAFAPGQAISRTLGLMGADLILSPCAWAVPAEHDNIREPYGQLWLDNYAPVARDFKLWIAGVSGVGPIATGPWAGRKCIGSSLLIGPDGQPAVRGPYGEDAEAILYHEIHLVPRPARGDQWADLQKGSR
jgi:predicted amidohydrolase